MPADSGAGDVRSFEETYARLEQLVARLESGDLTLDQALQAYEAGVAALRRCHGLIEVAERRLELLVEGEGGEPVARPVDLQALRSEARGRAEVQPAPAPAARSTEAPAAAPAAPPAAAPGPAPAAGGEPSGERRPARRVRRAPEPPAPEREAETERPMSRSLFDGDG